MKFFKKPEEDEEKKDLLGKLKGTFQKMTGKEGK